MAPAPGDSFCRAVGKLICATTTSLIWDDSARHSVKEAFQAFVPQAHMQLDERGILLNWMERAVRTRKECAAFGWGTCHIIGADHPAVLAHCCAWQDDLVLAVHNLSDQACIVTFDLSNYPSTCLLDLFSDRQYKPLEKKPLVLILQGTAFGGFVSATRQTEVSESGSPTPLEGIQEKF